MYHKLLAEQLAFLGLSPDEVPDQETWVQFLASVSQAYGQRSAEQDRLQAVLDNVADAIMTFDENGRIEWFNRAAEQMFGYTAAEIQGQHLEKLLPDPHLVQVEQDTLALSTAKGNGRADILSISNEIAGQQRDGTIFPLAFTISQMLVQGERQFIGIARDITRQKQDETALLAAKEEAEQANQSKSRFLANTSHEIRTPLSAIIGLTSLLLDTELTTAQRTYAETARQSSNKLLEILNDILDLSKIEVGKLELLSRPFHLQACVMEVVQLLKTTASEKGLHLFTSFDQTMPQAFEGDANRLRQILMNLISNAIKFTPQGEIQVRVAGQDLPGELFEVHIVVQDTGIGLPPDHESWLFEAFHRGNSGERQEYNGTGLGLTITKRLVGLMHGRIWVESEVNQGSTFHVTLPLVQSDEPIAENLSDRVRPFDPDMSQTHPLRILVAEDNATNQKVTLWMLEHLGYRADVAANGREVLSALEGQPYDLIIMDMQMPELDGLATSKFIRQSIPAEEQPWIIAVTADVNFLKEETISANGLNDFLSKPVQAEALITALCRCPSGLEQPAEPVEKLPAQEGRQITETWPVDKALLAKVVDQNETRLAEILSIFQKECDLLLGRLNTAVAEDNWETTRQMAHALKGSCATIGITSLVDMYNTIETMAREKSDFAEIGAKISEAQIEYQEVMTALKSMNY